MNTGYTFRNWSRVYRARPRQYHQPSTEAELQALLQQAIDDKHPIRIVGGGHSWSPIALTDDLMLNLDRYSNLIELNTDQQTVTVQAGMRLKDLNRLLDERGYALPNLGSISEQSAAGVISTGTHGTGIGNPILAANVVRLTLLTTQGKKELTPDNGFTFKAALVSLGCLGLISTVTFKIVPAFNLEETAYPLPVAEALAQLPDLLQQYRHLKLWWFPHAPRLQVYGQNITDQSAPAPSAAATYFNDVFMDRYVFTGLLKMGNLMPAIIPRMNGLINVLKFKPTQRIAKSFQLLNVPMPPIHRESEYAIPVEHAATVIQEVAAMIEQRKLRINFVLEVRFVQGDDIPLSPAYGRDSCYIGAYKAGNNQWPDYLEAFEEIMLKYDGRPHWGKEFSLSGEVIRKAYPEMDSFLQLRQQLDPDGIFLNRLTRKVFFE